MEIFQPFGVADVKSSIIKGSESWSRHDSGTGSICGSGLDLWERLRPGLLFRRG
jgi:hypothetical protein